MSAGNGIALKKASVRQSKNCPYEMPYSFVKGEGIKLTGAKEPPKDINVRIGIQERGKQKAGRAYTRRTVFSVKAVP